MATPILTRLRALSPHVQGHLAMLTFSALVAGSFALGGQIANEIAPVALTAVRFAIAAGLVAAIAGLTNGLRRSHFRAPWRFAILGLLFATYFVLMFEALKTATPVSTAAVFTLTPVISAGVGYVLLRQVTTRRMAVALAIGATGALWVIFQADLGMFLAFDIGRGELIFFVGCIAHAIYAPMARKLNLGEPAPAFTLGMLIAGCVLLSLAGWNDLKATEWTSLRPMVWITLFYLSIFASAATFLLLQVATLRLPSAKVMAYTYLTPAWVILWQMALGQETPGPSVLVGVALICGALLLLLKDEHGL